MLKRATARKEEDTSYANTSFDSASLFPVLSDKISTTTLDCLHMQGN